MTGDLIHNPSTNNPDNPASPTLYDQLKDLREKFFSSLIKLCEDEEGKPRVPSHQEMTVIRGVLRDNGMCLPPEDPESLKRAINDVKAGLPDFQDEEHDDNGEERDE